MLTLIFRFKTKLNYVFMKVEIIKISWNSFWVLKDIEFMNFTNTLKNTNSNREYHSLEDLLCMKENLI